MAGIIAITVRKRSYKGRGIRRGQSIPLMMENALRSSLGPIVQDVKHKLPGKRLAAHTHIRIDQTPQGASAHLVIGEGIPFANVQAKWDNSPTEIKPTGGRKHLAIPITAFGKGLQNKIGTSLLEWGDDLHPLWYSEGKGNRGSRGHTLYWKKNTTKHFYLAHSVKVKPSVNLHDVQNDMRNAANAGIRAAFEGPDFGFVRMTKG